jgi:hypothetical protein
MDTTLSPFLIAELLDTLDDLDARVRKQNVHLPIGVDHRVYAVLHRVRVGHVHVDPHMPIAERPCGLFRRIEVDIGDHHLAARRRKGLGDFQTDTSRTASDDADLAVEFHGDCVLPDAEKIEPVIRAARRMTGLSDENRRWSETCQAILRPPDGHGSDSRCRG